jgi:cholesterol transport system auxiliary component
MMSEPKTTSLTISRRRAVISGAAILGIALSGCQVPGGGTPPRRVRLSPADDFPPNLPSVAWTLQVQEPDTTLALNTAKIAYVSANGDINYLSTGEWTSRAPEMVMELLVESFKNTDRMLSVGDRRARIRPDFELESTLSAFQVEETESDAGVVRIELNGRLVEKPRRTALSAFAFDADVEAQPLTLDNIIAAFRGGLQDVMAQAVEWTLRTGAAV